MICSISRMKLFKACPRAYFLKYVEDLTPLQQISDALTTGSNYHELLEEMYNSDGDFQISYTKECAMATAYRKYIYPQLKVVSAEEWLRKPIGDHTMIGRVDGIDDAGLVVEHKTTSCDIGAEYEYNLQWDEQVLAYMYMQGCRKIRYTVCKKPTIRKKQNESDEDFYDRMVEWYDTDTDSKIRTFIVERTDEEVKEFADDFAKTCNIIENAKLLYRNTCHCNAWGRRCEYSSICLNYDPNQEYVEFMKGGKTY